MKRVLVIEDDKAIAELERDYLEISGLSVDVETDGQKGMETALAREYDLLIVDIMLPGMDGFSICKALRAVRDTPIMIVSAKTSDIDKIRAFGLGADDYMIKPFSPAELTARVQAHLSRYERLTGGSRNSIITVEDINIDLEYKIVRRGETEIAVTASEWCILDFLVRERGRIRTREEIFGHLHGTDSYGDQNVVAVHIRRLREKIERFPADPKIIETIWGMGYRIP